jgi:hypothetical protein
MIFGRKIKPKKNHRFEWQRRWAWYPVHLIDGRWAWFEYVETISFFHSEVPANAPGSFTGNSYRLAP